MDILLPINYHLGQILPYIDFYNRVNFALLKDLDMITLNLYELSFGYLKISITNFLYHIVF